MAKAVTAGEMCTRIKVTTLTTEEDAEGFSVQVWLNVLASHSYAAMPAPGASYLGQTAQYTGATVTGPPAYIQNGLYTCVLTGSVYSWEAAESSIRCKWVSAHGSDTVENNRLELGQIATITLRHTALIDQRCRVFHENDEQTDANAWTVISVNDPEDRHRFVEATLQRKVAA